MNWKREIQIIDLMPHQFLEVTCKTCGHSRYENVSLLIKKHGLYFEYLDEVERILVCNNRTCKGQVRVGLSAHDETEGFVGGIA